MPLDDLQHLIPAARRKVEFDLLFPVVMRPARWAVAVTEAIVGIALSSTPGASVVMIWFAHTLVILLDSREHHFANQPRLAILAPESRGAVPVESNELKDLLTIGERQERQQPVFECVLVHTLFYLTFGAGAR